ncbi:hypothetical protein [Pectobacterium carotovorum]|uniref:hypothetical protein n=1 Tax=Pectobacterium carotovorum TaxID=554 RepID=UPI001F40EF37|nr:hypothetical protein [Pectobacterium carotovorum]
MNLNLNLNLNLYVKAHLFNSTNAAFELAKKSKNESHQHFAEALVLKKIYKIGLISEKIDKKTNKKLNKYHMLFKELMEISSQPKNNSLYDSFNDNCLDAMNALINSSEHISDMKKGIVKASDIVINDNDLSAIRRVVTNLAALSSLENNEKLVSDATRFLAENIAGNHNFQYFGNIEAEHDSQYFGNKTELDCETLHKVKDHLNKIKEWAA